MELLILLAIWLGGILGGVLGITIIGLIIRAIIPPTAHFCEQCGATLAPGVRFCGSCGTAIGGAAQAPERVDNSRYCWSCDSEITALGRNAESERTCLHCGARVDYPETAQ